VLSIVLMPHNGVCGAEVREMLSIAAGQLPPTEVSDFQLKISRKVVPARLAGRATLTPFGVLQIEADPFATKVAPAIAAGTLFVPLPGCRFAPVGTTEVGAVNTCQMSQLLSPSWIQLNWRMMMPSPAGTVMSR
jgi:hypothetical protein